MGPARVYLLGVDRYLRNSMHELFRLESMVPTGLCLFVEAWSRYQGFGQVTDVWSDRWTVAEEAVEEC